MFQHFTPWSLTPIACLFAYILYLVPMCVCVCGWWWWGFYAINSAFIDASSGYPFLISNCWWKQPDFCLKSECCFEVELQNHHYFYWMFFPGFLTAKLNLLGYYLHRSIVYMKIHICEQVWVVCLSVSGSTVHQESKKVSLITIHWTVWGDRGTQNTETSA